MTEILTGTTPQRLLLAADGSEFSEGAVREAVKLTKLSGGTLFVLAVIETNPELETIAPQLIEKAEKETRTYLESVKAAADKEGVACELIARHSEEPYAAIVEEARKNKIQMIVMGRRGRTGLRRLLMGSVTAKVIGHSPCNVLVVPKSAEVKAMKILVATDGSRFSKAAASEAIGIAKRTGASLVVISVLQTEESSPFDIVHSHMQHDLIIQAELKAAQENVDILKDAAQKEGVQVEAMVLGGRPYEAIVDTVKKKFIDLIVIGSHGRTGIDRLLMGSVTERVVGHADCAVLVVKA